MAWAHAAPGLHTTLSTKATAGSRHRGRRSAWLGREGCLGRGGRGVRIMWIVRGEVEHTPRMHEPSRRFPERERGAEVTHPRAPGDGDRSPSLANEPKTN